MNRTFQPGFGVLILVMILTLVSPTPSAMATPPLGVHIEVPATIDITIDDPFTASGPAVDNGLLCPTGMQADLSLQISGPPGGNFRILKIVKRFDCADGSGTFDLKLIVRLDLLTSYTSGRWHITGGTGAYTHLHGNGKLVGIPMVPNTSILDIYNGRLH